MEARRGDAATAVLALRDRSSLFAVATLPGLSGLTGAGLANLLCFVGSWFFTTAGWMQLVLSGSAPSIGWLSAATQFVGTVLFNLSTGAALWSHAVTPERRLGWAPDAAGSSAFLVSGVLGVIAVSAAVGLVAPRSRDWQAEWINLVGCVAFGVSAVGAYVSSSGLPRMRCWPTSELSPERSASWWRRC